MMVSVIETTQEIYFSLWICPMNMLNISNSAVQQVE